MNKPNPIIRVPTRQDKIDTIRVAHKLGFRWEDSLVVSIDHLTNWPDEDIVRYTHVALVRNHNGDGRYISWLRARDTEASLRPGLNWNGGFGFTLVNSLSHLQDYIASIKP